MESAAGPDRTLTPKRPITQLNKILYRILCLGGGMSFLALLRWRSEMAAMADHLSMCGDSSSLAAYDRYPTDHYNRQVRR